MSAVDLFFNNKMEKVRGELALFSVEKSCVLHLTSQSAGGNFDSYCKKYSPEINKLEGFRILYIEYDSVFPSQHIPLGVNIDTYDVAAALNNLRI